MNGLDRAIIDDAVNLDTLYFNGNLCANSYFRNFLLSRAQYLLMLERCFSNIRFIVGNFSFFFLKEIIPKQLKKKFLDTITEDDDDFSFFDGQYPGIAVRVNTTNEIQIVLTPFNFI